MTLRRADGSERVVHPRHLVFATGVSGIPDHAATCPASTDFAGTVVHSGAFTNAEQWKGRKALVLGTGNSGHDVAQELHAHGADVTMVQRSTTYVVSLQEAQSVYAIYAEGIPFDDCDLLATSFPYPVLQRSYQLSTAKRPRGRRTCSTGSTQRGFRLRFGEDDTGFQMMYLRRGGGYYFNVGCSDLIIAGAIKLLQFADIDRFVAEGARLKDGRIVPADLVVLATGYKNQQDTVRAYLGDAIADRIGPVWGFDEGGELRNMWRRTAQPGLWFTAGSLAQCRIYSRYLAIQIKAIEEGMAGLGSAPLPQRPQKRVPAEADRQAGEIGPPHADRHGQTMHDEQAEAEADQRRLHMRRDARRRRPPRRVCRMTKNELIATGKKANTPEKNEPIE